MKKYESDVFQGTNIISLPETFHYPLKKRLKFINLKIFSYMIVISFETESHEEHTLMRVILKRVLLRKLYLPTGRQAH